LERGPESTRLVGTIERGPSRERREVDFSFDGRADVIAESPDPFLVAMLTPAMLAGERLESALPASPRLLYGLHANRDIFHTWFPELQRIEISAPPQTALAAVERAPRAAAFFSGGVDSFYTLLKYRHGETLPAPFTHIIYMRGVERRLDQARGMEESERRAREIAERAGVQCLAGISNIRTEFPLHWERYYFGSGLAAIALALSNGFGYVCIPASYSLAYPQKCGSTPLTDERFSTERTQIVHDGADRTRAEKVAQIVEWDRDLVLSYLRVCIENRGAAFNCGRCYKCVRTGIALKIVGAWQDAQTFPDKRTDHWEQIVAQDHPELTEENLALAERLGTDAKLTAMLRRVARKHRRVAAAGLLMGPSGVRRLRSVWHTARSVAAARRRTTRPAVGAARKA
jgi:hypothetical protein